MSEIKREPFEVYNEDGDPWVCFDPNHTLSDFIRYLLTQCGPGGSEDLIHIINVESKNG